MGDGFLGFQAQFREALHKRGDEVNARLGYTCLDEGMSWKRDVIAGVSKQLGEGLERGALGKKIEGDFTQTPHIHCVWTGFLDEAVQLRGYVAWGATKSCRVPSLLVDSFADSKIRYLHPPLVRWMRLDQDVLSEC